ncbi:GAF domain-containing protein [Conyzicola nivalis]|uniref:GAF domain-containing protein n=1 Tax=Conyzicola nivalis TaxID=1477021 RepID=A0A916SS98_9MICO|nr:GAF and ANTAR domain-containing protein [Conyzicola nivalis]GGB13310.1 GAF domain-containing protein [Conyzicola nivalis]
MSAEPAVTAVGQRLAAPFIDLLPVTGVAISVLDQQVKSSVIHASDATSARLEEIHFDLGDGPMFDCVASATPVLIPDVTDAGQWSMFTSHASELDAAAVFVFPLTLGAASVGAVLCYRTEAGDLDADAVDMGSALGRAIAGPALRQAILLADDEQPDGESPIETRREVHQATGMALMQLDTTATDALARMRAYAFSRGVSLRDVARDVVSRRLDFSQSKDHTTEA